MAFHQRFVLQQPGRRPIRHQPPAVEDHCPGAQVPHQAHVVAGDQHRLGQFAQQADEVAPRPRIQPG